MTWYEDTTQYTNEEPLGGHDWGDRLGLVHVYEVMKDGEKSVVTTSGWGKTSFMERHKEGKFTPRKYLRRYAHGRAFGIIMRSTPLLCVDIDGKNGGLATSRVLQLPPTLAERSKSGNGYHLFYQLEDNWDEQFGYSEYEDFNGVVPGVDVRGTGIVYHYPGQRWNNLPPAPLSLGVRRLLDQKTQSRQQRIEQVQRRADLTETELEELRWELLEDLDTRIRPGKRNTWLFAWGCRALGIIGNWDQLLAARGEELGLSDSEVQQVIRNVLKYGTGSLPVG